MTYNPLLEFEALRRIADEVFLGNRRNVSQSMPATIYEKDSGYLIQLLTPGVKKEDLSVDFEKGALSIRVKRVVMDEEKAKDLKTIRRERESYDFTRRYAIPEDTDIEKIEAEIKDGLLLIHMPKQEKSKPKKISVKVK